MQVQSVNSNQAFRGIGSAFKGVANAFDYTAQTTSDIADLVSTASLAMDTPDVATVKILNDKLNNVSNNKSVPKPVRKGIKYTCCAVATALTFCITRNCLRGKGVIVDLISKSKLGKSAINFVSSMKESIAKMKLTQAIKNSFLKTGYDKAVTFIKNTGNSALEFSKKMINKTPKIKSAINSVANFLNIRNWTKRDYFANIAATYIAGRHAIKALKTPEEATKPEAPIIEKPLEAEEVVETETAKADATEPDADEEAKDAA